MKCLNKNSAVFVWALLLSTLCQADGISWNRERAEKLKSGTGTTFAMDQLDARMTWLKDESRDEQLAGQVRISRTEFAWGGSNALSETYYWLSVPLAYQQRRGRNWALVAEIEPGVLSDGHLDESKVFYADAQAAVRYFHHKDAFWQLGAVVSRDFGDSEIYPQAAFSVKPDRITQVQLGFPYSHIQANWTPQVASYARLAPAGGLWREKRITGKAGEVQYRSWQLATGMDFLWRDGLWWNLELGGLFKRSIRAHDAAGAVVRAVPKNSPYWSLGLKYEF